MFLKSARSSLRTLVVVAVAAGASLTPAVTGQRRLPANPGALPMADHATRPGNHLPIVFERNVGQAAAEIRFIARGNGMTALISDSEILVAVQTRRLNAHTADAKATAVAEDPVANNPDARPYSIVRLRVSGSASGLEATGSQPLATRINYLRGRDPAGWHTNVPTFAAIRIPDIAPDVDLVLSGDGGIWSHQYELGPDADIRDVRIDVTGAQRVETSATGELVLTVGNSVVRYGAPRLVSGQSKAGEQAEFVAIGDGRIGLRRSTGPSTVEPRPPAGVVFSTYLGGSIGSEPATNTANAVGSDSTGAIYISGTTNSVDLPGVMDSPQSQLGGPRDIYVAKMSPDGASLIYATYLGGPREETFGGMVVGSDGSVYVTGSAYSAGFPRTPGALNLGFENFVTDVFVAKIMPSGQSLGYSCLIGSENEDQARALAVTSSGDVVVAATTASGSGEAPFPVTPGAFDTTQNGDVDSVVFKVNASGSVLTWSTLLGGAGPDEVVKLALGATNSVYVAGRTVSQGSPYPTTAGAYRRTYPGGDDVFLTRLGSNGQTLAYSTLFGGVALDSIRGLDLDADGNAVITGYTQSPAPGSFPTTPGAYQTDGTGPYVTKFNSTGSALLFSTLLTNGIDLLPSALAFGASGEVCVAGSVYSSGTGLDVGVALVSANGASLNATTMFGGYSNDEALAVDVASSGALLIAGSAVSPNFPTTVGSLDNSLTSAQAGFVSKHDPASLAPIWTSFFEGPHTATGGDGANGIAVDSTGASYIVGTVGTVDFPVSDGFDETLGGRADASVTKLSPDGSAIVYSTFIGAGDLNLGYDGGMDIAVDANGAAFVIGETQSADFPVTPGAFDTTFAGGNVDAFVLKLAPDGASLEFSTYLGADGGFSGQDNGIGIVVDGSGSPIVCGTTNSDDFPTTPGAFSRVRRGTQDVFVTRLAPDGTALMYSTYLGGDDLDWATGVAIGPDGSAFVCGISRSLTGGSFPATEGAVDTSFGGQEEGFVTRFSLDGSALLFSTYLGGINNDWTNGIVVNAAGEATVVGMSVSPDYPVFAGYDLTINDSGQGDFVVTKLNSSGSALIYSTFLGGLHGERPKDIAMDTAGRAIIVGRTAADTVAEMDYPVTENAFQRVPASTGPSVVSILSPAGDALVYSTFLSGSLYDDVRAVAADAAGGVYVVGQATSVDFPVVTPLQAQIGGAYDMFVTKFVVPGTSRDTAGVYVASSGAWFLRDSNTPGNANIVFTYGPGGAGAVPLRGDWDGDGLDGPGLYFPSTGAFFLKNARADGDADHVFTYGTGGAGMRPIVGDWNADGTDTVGLYAAANGAFFLRNSNDAGPADLVFTFGGGGSGVVPLAGDWDGSGSDTVGLYVSTTRAFFLRNSNSPGLADRAFVFGPPSASPIVGDWNADGVDSIGVHIPATGAWFLRNSSTPGSADVVFTYGPQNAVAIAGDWDGQ